MPKVFVQVKPSESRIWNYITLTTPPTFYSELTMKLASRHHFNLVSLTGRKVEWFFVWEYRFLLWASPPPGLCHPMSYAPLMCRSSIAQHLSVACLHFLALHLEVPIIFPFYVFFENFIHIFIIFSPNSQILLHLPTQWTAFLFFLCLVKTSDSKKETDKTKTKHTREWFVLAGYCAGDLLWPVVAILSVTPLKKKHFPSLSSYQLEIAQWLGKKLLAHPFLQILDVFPAGAGAGIVTIVVSSLVHLPCCAWNMLFPWSHLWLSQSFHPIFHTHLRALKREVALYSQSCLSPMQPGVLNAPCSMPWEWSVLSGSDARSSLGCVLVEANHASVFNTSKPQWSGRVPFQLAMLQVWNEQWRVTTPTAFLDRKRSAHKGPQVLAGSCCQFASKKHTSCNSGQQQVCVVIGLSVL